MQATTEQKAEAPPVRRMPGPNIFDESRPMWRYFLAFLIPLMLSSVLQSAGSTLNSIFVGRLIGVDALGAISAFFPLLFFLFSFLAGLASGASVLIGQAYGAGDQHKMKRVIGTALSMGLSLGIAVTLVGLLCRSCHERTGHAAEYLLGCARVRTHRPCVQPSPVRVHHLRIGATRNRRLADPVLRAHCIDGYRHCSDTRAYSWVVRSAAPWRFKRSCRARYFKLGRFHRLAYLS